MNHRPISGSRGPEPGEVQLNGVTGQHRMLITLAAILFLFILMGTHRDAFGQQPREVTFNEAVNIALQQNIDLKIVANTAELNAISIRQQRSNFYPDLYLSGQGSQNYGRNFIAEEGRILNMTTEQIGINVGSNINLFSGFGDVAGLRQAQLATEAAELDYDRARQSVVFQVMFNFLTLIEQGEQIRVLQENLESQQQQLQQVEGLVEVGNRPPSELYQQQAAVAGAELAVVEAQQAYQVTESALIQVLKLDPFGQYEFVAPEVEDEIDVEETYPLAELLERAYQQRPDLRAREASIDAAREGIRVAQSTRWPTVGLGFGYGTNYTTADQFGLFDQFDQRRGGSISLNLSVPIFDRFLTGLNVQRAEVAQDNAELALENARQDVAVQVRQARLDLVSAQKRLEVSATQERAAQQALEVEEERYAVGVGTLVELSLARAEYVRAASGRVTAKYDYIFQTKLIDYYLGVLDPREPLF